MTSPAPALRVLRLGFDVGGSKIDAVAATDTGEIVRRVRRSTGWGADAVVGAVAETAVAMADDLGVPTSAFASVGVGIPGQADADQRTISHAVNLGIERLDLAAALEPVLGTRVRTENDVKAAALGAAKLHGRPGTTAYLNIGTGIAAGFVTDGVLWRGARGTSGEVGHIVADPNGPLCRCGQRGCIEMYAGGGAIARRWGKDVAFPVVDVFDAADAGDPEAVVLRDGIAFGVASALRLIALSIDPDFMVLGGGVTALGDRMLTRVMAELERAAEASPFLASLDLSSRVSVLPARSPVAALGAALIAVHPHEQEAHAHG
ncbi:ROK family protein [Microbacterium telephonicum]|uniref:Putative NBD/HSP70 family sugar kinase n=1 Tax=Microbacterium telephonicum TaxID=1714841 RepID=A0A498BVT6_9MICO|nr:ROK family protein [Microbacterium telephonicum]RLK47843.1 putative NBD/HSP70 family sugar kinase [Microbacterium telephonicum]